MRLLLLEDDALLADALTQVLSDEGYIVDGFAELGAADQALNAADYEIAILDVVLPDGSGLDLLGRIRNDDLPISVLILTARDAIDDRVTGLDHGADDYLVKPFEFDELLARLRALRRRHVTSGVVYRHGSIEFEPTTRRVIRDGVPVNLSRREISMLELFLEHRGRVLTREFIYGQLYGWHDDVQSNTIEVFVHNLRQRLGVDLIRTVRGVGYVMDAEPQQHRR